MSEDTANKVAHRLSQAAWIFACGMALAAVITALAQWR